jgi:mediator of RNA polymerase II transcription subunit 5
VRILEVALDSLFSLHQAYDSDALVEYFRLAILTGLLDLPTFLSNFLVKYKPDPGQNLSGLQSLAQLVIDVHFASPKTTPLPVTLVREVLTILKSLYMFPLSPFDTKVLPIAQFAILVLSLAGNTSDISTHQAAECYTLCSDILQIYELPADIRTPLEAYLMSLGLVLGDETKAAREVEDSHPNLTTSNNHSVVNPNVGSNIAAISLMLHQFVRLFPFSQNLL